MIPGYKSIRAFAKQFNINYSTVKTQMRRGYCQWPRRSCSQQSLHPLYSIWCDMKSRCHNPTDKAFRNYGGRGIGVDLSWRIDFWQFVADVGDRPSPLHSLDRADNNLGYSKRNCRWATRRTQARNTRNYTGNIRQLNGKYQGRLWIKDWVLYTPLTPDYEQAQIDLEQLEYLYQDYL